MKFVIDNWALILVAFTSGAMLLWPVVGRSARASGLSPNQAVLVINRERGVVVDVSEADEFRAGHIVGSRNVPLNDLEKRLPEVVKNKSLPLILVCATGARANRALATVKNLGYQQAQVLGGGLAAWKEANLPLEKG